MYDLLDHTRPPRETFNWLPGPLQPLVTFLSGKPLPNQSPLFSISPVTKTWIDFAKLVVGLTSGAAILGLGGWWLMALPLVWVIIVNGAVSLKLDSHYAAHFCITGNGRIDTRIGEVLTALVLSPNMEEYADGHTIQHHGLEGIGTIDDPDLGLLFLMGFESGRDVGWYRRRLLLTLVSPRYHLLFAWERVRLNFFSGPFPRRLLAFAVHGTILGAVAWSGLWYGWALLWLLPVGPLMQISIALQVPAEHLWLTRRAPKEPPRLFVRRISHGRFFLIPSPKPGLGAARAMAAWTYWSIVSLIPLIERSFVCVSVMPAHDYHHRHAKNLAWPMEKYMRQKEIDGGATDFRDVYGLWPALSELFNVWSDLPPDFVPKSPTTLRFVEACTSKTMNMLRPTPRGL